MEIDDGGYLRKFAFEQVQGDEAPYKRPFTEFAVS
jgi:hypothetical protein